MSQNAACNVQIVSFFCVCMLNRSACISKIPNINVSLYFKQTSGIPINYYDYSTFSVHDAMFLVCHRMQLVMSKLYLSFVFVC